MVVQMAAKKGLTVVVGLAASWVAMWVDALAVLTAVVMDGMKAVKLVVLRVGHLAVKSGKQSVVARVDSMVVLKDD